ncbi:MAG TPA: FlgO family outer membrane protein [Pyrinomonadaceae bacterium]|nr:FlgO family outer membrane protein [Pyrinomonadaceae bacterium]
MAERDQPIYEFGEYRLNVEDGSFWRVDDRIAATQKSIELLTMLLENRGRVVTRDEIIERLWPETFVDENNLSVTVSMLRKALGNEAATLIETIPRKGYRFNGEVIVSKNGHAVAEREFTRTTIERIEFDDEETTKAIAQLGRKTGRQSLYLVGLLAGLIVIAGLLVWSYLRRADPLTKQSTRTVAVLPFKDLSQDEKGKQFSIGLADSLITKLAGIRGLTVRPMSAVMPNGNEQLTAESAGTRLNVETVLEGTIQREGETFRVSVQLVNAKDNQVIWANVLEEKSQNLFGFQRLLSSQVADALAFKLSANERNNLARQPTDNSDAYRAYILGRFYFNKRTSDDLRSAVEQFKQAISLDPAYADAYSGLAASFLLMSDSGYGALPPGEGYPTARLNAQKAIELDNANAEAHAVIGQLLTGYDWKISEGERSLRRAIELNPSFSTAYQWLGWNLIIQRRTYEASESLARALELDPTSLTIASDQGYPQFFAGEFDAATQKFRAALALDKNYPSTTLNIWRALHYGGRLDEASGELLRVEAFVAKDLPVLIMARGCTLARQGDVAQARALYDQLISRRARGEFIAPNFTATLAAELGLADDVFSDLNRFVDDRNDYTAYLGFVPEFEKYRSDPRFGEIIARAGVEF